MKTQKISINNIADLKLFIKNSSDLHQLEEVCSKALKICYIIVGEPNLEETKEHTLEFISKYWENNSHFEKPLFICIGWKLNFKDYEKQ